jgi:CubicO group peptidase (beta-lactamase class C family)
MKSLNTNYLPTKEWQYENPENLGFNAEQLNGIDKEIKLKYKNLNSILIVRKGYIVFEKYYNNSSPDTAHNVASVTKSFISALIGIAIDKGYIKSIDQKILDFFPEFQTEPTDFQKRIITIRHILTMTAPFAWQTGASGFEPLNRFRKQKNWINFILSILGKNGNLGKFKYSSLGAHLLSAIISITTGMSAREFANKYLFEPLGINLIPDYKMSSFSIDDVFGKNIKGWFNDPQGYTSGGWGLTITARDMARFGYLYLNQGNWDGKQIISKQWIQDSTEMNENKYGYFWWLFNIDNHTAYTAAGAGGNHIFCIPHKDLIVVIASKIVLKFADRGKLIENIIIPSLD